LKLFGATPGELIFGFKVPEGIFEFRAFNKQTFLTPADFLAVLVPFLKTLSEGFRYAVEIRNENYLKPQYFDALTGHNALPLHLDCRQPVSRAVRQERFAP
jgi:hypothetical protein